MYSIVIKYKLTIPWHGQTSNNGAALLLRVQYYYLLHFQTLKRDTQTILLGAYLSVILLLLSSVYCAALMKPLHAGRFELKIKSKFNQQKEKITIRS